MPRQVVILQNSIKTTFIFRKGYIKALLDSGVNVIVIAPCDCAISKRKLMDLGVNVKDIPDVSNKISLLKSIYFMNKSVIEQRGLDTVVVCHFLVTFIMCFPSLLTYGRRCIIYIEGLGSLFSRNKLLQKVIRELLKLTNAVKVFCNQDEKTLVGGANDYVSGGIGVDLKKFTSPKRCFSSDKFQLLYVGRLIEDKGVLHAIETLRFLLKKGLSVKLNLVGDVYPNNPSSLSFSSIEEIKSELGDSINFVGYSQDIKCWYDTSDVLLLPSKREGFPVCVMEANAMGIPAVCYSVPGCSDAIETGTNGFLVEQYDVTKYAEMVEKILDYNLLNNISQSAIYYAHANFDSNKKNANLIKLINEAS